MRHTEIIPLQFDGAAYILSAHTAKKLRAFLKKENATQASADAAFVRAEHLYPELDDPIMGAALYLRGIRLREGLTQAALAERTGILQHHISLMEHGKRNISKESAKKFAAALNADWRRFL